MRFIDIHSHRTDTKSLQIINLELNADIDSLPTYFSVGVHPWKLKEPESFSFVEKFSQSSNCLAIGETGLDRYYPQTWQEQIRLFHRHLELAQETRKPVILHIVKAYSDLLEIIKNYPLLSYILHDFNGNKHITNQLLKYDVYFSFGKKLFQQNSRGFQVFPHLNLNRIFLETDDTEYNISQIYERAAKLRGLEPEKLMLAISQNWDRVFLKQQS